MGERRKTTVEIDLLAVREAAEHLGTRGLKETINAALHDVNRRAALERGAAYLRERRDHPPPAEHHPDDPRQDEAAG